MGIKSFQDLDIWKRSVALVTNIYNVTKVFPKEELYGLTGQLRRAAVSIPSNIAEGFTKYHNGEYKQFLYVATGSGAELKTQIIIALNLDYLRKEEADILLDEIEQISKMTMSLIKKLNTND